MTLVVDVVEAPSGAPVELTGQQAAKSWANLNGTGTIALRDSFNISSAVDNGVGDFTFNYSNSMSNSNYGMVSSCASNNTVNNDGFGYSANIIMNLSTPLQYNTTGVRIGVGVGNGNNSANAENYINIHVHGDLA